MQRIQQWLLAALLCGFTASVPAQQRVPLDTAIELSLQLKQLDPGSFFRYINQHAGFIFVYNASLITEMKPVTYQGRNVPLHKLLDTVLGRQGLSYKVYNHFIVLKRDERASMRSTTGTLQGKVTDEKGEPLGGVSVLNKEKGLYAITSQAGIFNLPWPAGSREVVCTHRSYEHSTVYISHPNSFQRITLRLAYGVMEEVMVTEYVKATPSYKKMSAGSWVRGDELNRGSLNPISALSGRIPGLIVTETSGAPGAAVRVHIRGRQSIGTVPGIDNQPLNDPLLLLNKIPLITGNSSIAHLPSAAGDPQAGGGISAQAAINPADIESIEVLKDADATAIYGARGAHGAILINTYSGRLGRPRFRFSVESGAVTSTYLPSLLNNREYTAMRKEALAAAGVQPTVANAPDLLLLDTNNYINLPQLLAGGTGKLINANASVQGGDSLMQYYFSSSYYRESSVMPVSLPQQRFTTYAHIRYRSPGSRWQGALSLHYSRLHYQSIATDPMYSSRLVPLLPALRDANGGLVWEHNGFSFLNPLGQFATSNHTRIHTFNTSFQGQYRLRRNLFVRATLGYQWLPVKEQLIIPLASRNPATRPVGEVATAHSQYEGFMAEPQLVYEHKGDNLDVSALLGATFQEEGWNWNFGCGTGYTNDGELGLPGAAAKTTEMGYTGAYSYRSLFSRWHADWRNRYFLNATGRLDASSRFGPGGNRAFFGALGAAWVFSEEGAIKRAMPFLTHGKLRASYGTVGNDNTGDDRYLETWIRQPNWQLYDGTPKNRQANPGLDWEKNRKKEIALELEWGERVFFNAAWYHNSTANQFISIETPNQAGPAGSIIINAPARVVNTGWEFTVRSAWNWNRKYSLTSTFLLTLPRNRLASFPGIENTPYHTTLVVGQPLSVQQGYPFLGVDPNSGLYIVPTTAVRKGVIGHREPVAYASWFTEYKLGRFRMSILLEARKQKALSSLYYTYLGSSPGRWSPTQLTNQPVAIWQRWQQPGDQASLQRFTAANTTAVHQALHYYRESAAMLVDASFWRIRSLHLSWDLPEAHTRIYLQAQNLFTGTPYRDGDPTILYPLKLPSLRTITAGLQIDF